MIYYVEQIDENGFISEDAEILSRETKEQILQELNATELKLVVCNGFWKKIPNGDGVTVYDTYTQENNVVIDVRVKHREEHYQGDFYGLIPAVEIFYPIPAII